MYKMSRQVQQSAWCQSQWLLLGVPLFLLSVLVFNNNNNNNSIVFRLHTIVSFYFGYPCGIGRIPTRLSPFLSDSMLTVLFPGPDRIQISPIRYGNAQIRSGGRGSGRSRSTTTTGNLNTLERIRHPEIHRTQRPTASFDPPSHRNLPAVRLFGWT